MLRTFSLALTFATLLACSKADQPGPAKPAPASPKPADPEVSIPGNSELENRGVAMMQRMADMFAASANDCDKLAVDIKAFIVQNKELLDQLTALERTQSDQEKAAFEARTKTVQESIMQKMTPALTACGENPQVQAAMNEFPTEE